MQFSAGKLFLNEVEVKQGKQEIIRKKNVIDVLDWWMVISIDSAVFFVPSAYFCVGSY